MSDPGVLSRPQHAQLLPARQGQSSGLAIRASLHPPSSSPILLLPTPPAAASRRPPRPAMDHLNPHVHTNKPTSINQLLNPATPSSSLPPSYPHPQQLPSLANVVSYTHPPPAPPPSHYTHPSSSQGAGFGLRRANWDSGKEQPELVPRRSDSDPSSCHYPPSSSLVSHQSYADGYARQPPPEESHHYALNGNQPWSPAHGSPRAQYVQPPMMASMYPDERQGT